MKDKLLKSWNSINSKYVNNTLWLFAEQVTRMLLTIIVGIWVARYLGPEMFGKYNYALAFITLLAVFSSLGLNVIAIRELVRTPDKSDSIIGTIFYMRFFASIANILVIIVLIILIEKNENVVWLVIILSFRVLFNVFEVIDFYFQAKVNSKYAVKAKTISLLLSNVLKIALILSKSSIIMFAIVEVIESVLISFFLITYYYKYGGKLGKWTFSFGRAKDLIKESWPLIISSFGIIIYQKIDQIMLAKMTNDTEVGIYAVAVKLSEVWIFIPSVITASYFPKIVMSQKLSNDIYLKELQKLYDVMVVIALVITFPIIIFSEQIILLLYGIEFHEAASVLSIHVCGAVFVFMGLARSKWIVNEGLIKSGLVFHLTGAFINVVLNFFLIPIYYSTGAAVATVVSYFFAYYLATIFYKKTQLSAKMMTLALLIPFRAVITLIKMRRRKERGLKS